MVRGVARAVLIAGVYLFGLLQVSGAQTVRPAAAANPAVVAVPQGSAWWMTRHLERLEQVKQGGVDLLFVGDSITQNYEKAGPAPDEVFLPTWQDFFAPHRALNLGYSADRTQNVLWRLEHGEVDGLAPKDVVLLIGTNNTDPVLNQSSPETAEEVTAGVVAVVEALHAKIPGAQVLLIEILPSAVTREKSDEDLAVNQALRARYAKSNYVRCLDLSSLFLKDGALNVGLFYDSRLKTPRPPLHPDTQGQRLMAKAISTALYGSP